MSTACAMNFRWITPLLMLLAGCPAQTVTLQPSATQSAPTVADRTPQRTPIEKLFKISTADLPATRPATRPRIDSKATLAYMEGRMALVDGKRDLAVKHLKQALTIDENHLPARRLLARIYFDSGLFSLAKEQAAKLIEQWPGDITGHYVLGNILLRTGQFIPGGEHLYQTILLAERTGEERSATVLVARFLLGQALANRSYIQAAVQIYQPLLEYLEEYESSEPPREPQIQKIYHVYRPGLALLVADFLCRLERFTEAERYYLKAEKISTDKSRVRMGMIRCYRRAGKTAQARKVLAKLTASGQIDHKVITLYRQLYPQNTWTQKLLEAYTPTTQNLQIGVRTAEELMKLQHWSDAAGLLERLLKVDPSDSNVLWLAVNAYQKLGKLDRCARLLVDALAGGKYVGSGVVGFAARWDAQAAGNLAGAIDRLEVKEPQQFAKVFLKGMVAQAQGKLDRAEEFYRRAYQLNDKFVSAYQARGNLLLLQRRWSDAIEVIDEALKKNRPTGGLLYVKGRAQSELDRLDEAIETLQQARRSSPHSDQIVLALAEVFIRADQAGSAVGVLKAAFENAITGRETLSELVQTLFHADNLPLAKKLLEQYKGRFGADAQYELLQGKLTYQQDGDRSAYRSKLEDLVGKTARPGQARIELAELEYQAGNHRRTIELADELLSSSHQLWPRDYQRIVQLKALSHHRLLQYDRAEAAWKLILKDWPNRERFKGALAQMYLDAQQFEKALKLLTGLLARARTSGEKGRFQRQIIRAQLARDDLPGAVKLIKGWLNKASGPRRTGLQRLLVRAYLTKEHYDEAVKLLEKLLAEKAQGRREWQRALTVALVKQGKAEVALAKVETWLAEANDKDRPFIEGLKIPIYLKQGRFAEAVKLARPRWEGSKGHERFVRALTLISCYQQGRMYDQAEQFIREQLKSYPAKSPRKMDFHFQLIRTWELAGKFDQAEKYINDKLKEADGYIRLEWEQLLVRLYSARREEDKAVKLLEKILKRQGDLAWANNALGYSLADSNRQLDRAERLIRKALAAEPSNPAYLDSLGWVFYRKGKYEQAHKFLLMSIRAMTRADPVVLDHMGDVKVALGKVDQGREYWRRALTEAEEMDPIETIGLEPGLRERVLKKLGETQSTQPATRPSAKSR